MRDFTKKLSTNLSFENMGAHRVFLLILLTASFILLEGCKKDEKIDPVTHTLNLKVQPEGMGEITGAGVYEVGKTVEITAQALNFGNLLTGQMKILLKSAHNQFIHL